MCPSMTERLRRIFLREHSAEFSEKMLRLDVVNRVFSELIIISRSWTVSSRVEIVGADFEIKNTRKMFADTKRE